MQYKNHRKYNLSLTKIIKFRIGFFLTPVDCQDHWRGLGTSGHAILNTHGFVVRNKTRTLGLESGGH